jgi:hypothetical protein
VKLKACQEVKLSQTRVTPYALLAGIEDGTFDWREHQKKMLDAACERIEHWDIRCVQKLHELFPSCLPRNCRYVVELRDDGCWWIEA